MGMRGTVRRALSSSAEQGQWGGDGTLAIVACFRGGFLGVPGGSWHTASRTLGKPMNIIVSLGFFLGHPSARSPLQPGEQVY